MLLLATSLLMAGAMPGAFGSFNSSPSAPSMSISTDTLAAPTVASSVCLTGLIVRLTWVVSVDSWADGQEIWESDNGGAYYKLTTVGASTYTYTTGALSLNGDYYWKIRAKRNNWVSDFTNRAGVRITLLLFCTPIY